MIFKIVPVVIHVNVFMFTVIELEYGQRNIKIDFYLKKVPGFLRRLI